MIERNNQQCIFASATEFVDWKHAHPPQTSADLPRSGTTFRVRRAG